jgi:glucose-1-phosphate adenylyltransferase
VASIVHPLEGANRFGVIGTDGDAHILEFAEKPRNPRPLPDAPSSALVNMGVYLFDVDVLRAALEWDHRDAESSHDLGRDVLPRLVDQSRAFAFRFEEKDGEPGYWQDVGTVDSYYEASMAWLRHRRPATTGYVRNSVVAGNVRIHPTARVQDSILLSGVSVGAGARVSRAILNEKVQVQDGARVDAARSPDRYLTRTPAGVLVAASGAVIARSR